MNKLRTSRVLIITALLFGCATRGDVTSSGNVVSSEEQVGPNPVGAYNIDFAQGVATADIGDQTYLFVAARTSNAVSVFSVAGDGSLSFVADVRDGESGAYNIGDPTDVATAIIGGQTYLFVSAWSEGAVSVFRVANDGSLTFVGDVEDLERESRNLAGANSLATLVIGGQTYLFVGADRNSDDIKNKAVSVFRVANDGSLTFVDDISDGELGADNVEVATAVVARQTYLFVSVSNDSAVSVFNIDNDGSLTFADYIENGERGTNNLDGAWKIATAVIGGQTYLFVPARGDSAVSVFSVENNGRLSFVDDIRDGESGANNLEGAITVATEVIGGQTYLFVTALMGAVSVFSVADDGRLTFVDDIKDGESGSNSIFGANKVATAVVGGQIYLFVTAFGDDAVSVFSVADDGSLTFVDDVKHGEPIL